MVQILQRCRLQIGKYLICLAFLLGLGVRPALADGVTIFAASSLREATQDLSELYFEQTGETATLVFAASSTIARQIAQGAPASLALLADQTWADWLEEQGAVSTVAPFAGNRLVLTSLNAEPLGNVSDLPVVLGERELAMAQVDVVPAGRYGKSALEAAGLWGEVSAQIVQAANVRAALRFVERGEAPFGIGYASDLVALPSLNEVYSFAPDSHAPIVYLGAQVTVEGADFMTFLQTDAAQNILRSWGFSPVPNISDGSE